MPNNTIINSDLKPENCNQGNLSNCYLISSISALAEFPQVIKRLFNTQTNSHLGMYSVNLNADGVFKEIIVDGMVPVEYNRPKFCHSTEAANCLWPILLEKAYAKHYGGYWNIGGAGAATRALKDLTGAPTEFLKTGDKSADELFDAIVQADRQNFIMVVPTHHDASKVDTSQGLIAMHAYTCISALELDGTKVVKLRNPHGKGEWKGAWSDKSSRWTPELRAQVGLSDAVDGTFFMPLDDLKRNFVELAICKYIPSNILSQLPIETQEMDGRKAWKIHVGEAGEYYIGLGQPDVRHVGVEKLLFTSLILFKVDDQDTPIEYAGGMFYSERDPSFKTNLSKGTYILVVRVKSHFCG